MMRWWGGSGQDWSAARVLMCLIIISGLMIIMMMSGMMIDYSSLTGREEGWDDWIDLIPWLLTNYLLVSIYLSLTLGEEGWDDGSGLVGIDQQHVCWCVVAGVQGGPTRQMHVPPPVELGPPDLGVFFLVFSLKSLVEKDTLNYVSFLGKF